MNKKFADMPKAFKAFIVEAFKSIDVDGNFNEKPLKDIRFVQQKEYKIVTFCLNFQKR